jgi:DNA polymerase
MSKGTSLQKLNKTLSTCSLCVLRSGCSRIVTGIGNAEARIMFVGEAPGKKEDELGIPFVGSSGKILDKMLESIGLQREEVYLTNILKCRPPANRDPLPEEVSACLPWLEEEIKIINPEIIITLGRFSLNCFLPQAKISEVHGEIFKIALGNKTKLKLIPFYHPAAARQNKKTRALFTEDFQKITTVLR